MPARRSQTTGPFWPAFHPPIDLASRAEALVDSQVSGQGVKLFPQQRRNAHDRDVTGVVVCRLFAVPESPHPRDAAIEWVLYADDMPPKHGRKLMLDLLPTTSSWK